MSQTSRFVSATVRDKARQARVRDKSTAGCVCWWFHLLNHDRLGYIGYWQSVPWLHSIMRQSRTYKLLHVYQEKHSTVVAELPERKKERCWHLSLVEEEYRIFWRWRQKRRIFVGAAFDRGFREEKTKLKGGPAGMYWADAGCARFTVGEWPPQGAANGLPAGPAWPATIIRPAPPAFPHNPSRVLKQ